MRSSHRFLCPGKSDGQRVVRRKARINERLSHARVATQVCGRTLTCTAGSSVTYSSGAGATRRHPMAHLVDKEFVERANTMLLLGILWGGFAAWGGGAFAYHGAYRPP